MTTPTKLNPVIFIHGLWIHSTAWHPWIELFAQHVSPGVSLKVAGCNGFAVAHGGVLPVIDAKEHEPEASM